GCLAEEALDHVRRRTRMKDLERAAVPGQLVLDLVDLAHAAGTKGAPDPKLPRDDRSVRKARLDRRGRPGRGARHRAEKAVVLALRLRVVLGHALLRQAFASGQLAQPIFDELKSLA